jgi:hypothetical protein
VFNFKVGLGRAVVVDPGKGHERHVALAHKVLAEVVDAVVCCELVLEMFSRSGKTYQCESEWLASRSGSSLCK